MKKSDVVGDARDAGYFIDVVRGNIAGSRSFNSYGVLLTSGVPTTQLIWPDGAFLAPPAAGIQMGVSSSSAADGVGGTGIRSVEIHYLDNTLAEQVETIVLNGLTLVLTQATNIRFVQCMHIITYGTGKAAAGDIKMYNSTGTGQVYSMIATGAVRCASSARMVPQGKKAFISAAIASSISGTAASSNRIRLASTHFEGHDYTADTVFIPFGSQGFQDNGTGLTFPIAAGPFPAGSIIGMIVSTDNKVATVTGDWFGWIENA